MKLVIARGRSLQRFTNVAKYCVSHDSKTYYEASYDCTLAGATCVEGQSESGTPWAECQAPQLNCEGPYLSYCDGTRAVVCEESQPGVLSPWVYDCADAFGSHCIVPGGGGRLQCEGPLVGEQDCHDGKDGDGDGKIDCMDDDCTCSGEICDDGVDNDDDGKVDCADDSDCFCP